jgi:hypothetical protein
MVRLAYRQVIHPVIADAATTDATAMVSDAIRSVRSAFHVASSLHATYTA